MAAERASTTTLPLPTRLSIAILPFTNISGDPEQQYFSDGYFAAHRYKEAIAVLKEVRDPIDEVRGWLLASYAHAGLLAEARAMLEEFLRMAEHDMVVFPGRRLKNWDTYWRGTMWYKNEQDFDHLFEGLRKAGLSA